ncbi:MAG TPA: hypothetical protein VNA28_07965 [Solirubrobacteraceae bacterium]|nr:hypothetical protein [Solirubrobacteraceae bacterium]
MSAASANSERGSVALEYVDIVLVVIVAVALLATNVPTVGLLAGAAAWIVMRVAQIEADKQLVNIHDLRRRLGVGVAFSMLRVWLLAGAIIACGIAVSRADGLTAALVIFGAFSVNFVRNAVSQISKAQARSTTG